MASPARVRTVLLALVALLAALLVTPGPAAHAVDRQLVYGAIKFPQHDAPRVKMLWFDRNWNYLGAQGANGGGYSIRLSPGTYHLQFVDQRPSYDVRKYAPTDVLVHVAGHTVSKNVTMKRGAAITGTAKALGKPLAKARVVAANKVEQSFATTADRRGRFAIGGLPQGEYCLFTYDKARKWVDKCTWAGAVTPGRVTNEPVRLTKRAGNLTVFVETSTGSTAPKSTVTVTNRATGQWWTSKARDGKAVFRGVHPGRYAAKYDAAGSWFTQTGTVHGGSVRSGRMAFGDFTLTKRGGVVTGVLVDSDDPDSILRPQGTQPGAAVMLFAKDGTKLAETTSDSEGRFRLTGQIRTQDEMTIVVDPSNSSSGYMRGPDICQYQRTELSRQFSAVQGEESFTGPVPVNRVPGQPDPDCSTAAGRSRL